MMEKKQSFRSISSAMPRSSVPVVTPSTQTVSAVLNLAAGESGHYRVGDVLRRGSATLRRLRFDLFDDAGDRLILGSRRNDSQAIDLSREAPDPTGHADQELGVDRWNKRSRRWEPKRRTRRLAGAVSLGCSVYLACDLVPRYGWCGGRPRSIGTSMRLPHSAQEPS